MKVASVRSKIWICVAAAFAGYLIATLTTLWSNDRLSTELAHLREDHLPLVLKGIEAINTFKIQSKLYEDAFLMGEVEPLQEAGALTAELKNLILSMIREADHLDRSSMRGDLLSLAYRYDEYATLASAVYPRLAEGESIFKLQKQVKRLGEMRTELQAELEALSAHFTAIFMSEMKEQQDEARRNNIFLVVLLLAVLAAAAFVVNRVSRRLIIKPLEELKELVDSYAAGRLPVSRPSVQSGDEIGSLNLSFWEMTAQLQKTTVSRDYVDNIIKSMNDCLVVVAPDGIIRTVNPPVCALMGYDENGLVGEPVEKIFAPEDWQTFSRSGFQELIKSGSINNIEKTFLSRGGQKIPVLFSASPMINEEKMLVGVVCVAVDMTERKRSEEALRESEEHMKKILDSIHAGIMLVDAESHEIVDVNSFACNLIGASRAEIVGRRCHKFVCTSEEGACPITDRKERVDNSERLLVKSDGSSLPILKSVVAVPHKGRTLLIESFIDISMRKQFEVVLQSLVEGTASGTGDEFFRSLVRNLSSALKIKFAFVTRRIDGPQLRVRTLAFWTGQGFRENMEIPLAGTPCEKVLAGELKFYPEKLQALFPESEAMRQMGVESFLGMPLLDSSDNVIGHLAVLDDKPMDGEQYKKSLVRVFAARASAELERFLSGEKLDQLYKFLRTVLDSIDDPISILDAHSFEIVGVNKRFSELTGMSIEELRGRKCYEAIHGLKDICAGPENPCPLVPMLKTGTFQSTEHIRYRNGQKLVSEVSAHPIRDAEGNIVQVVHLAHDITERKMHEQIIRENEENLRTILDSIRAGVVVADPARHTIAYANPFMAALLGTTTDRVIGRKCHDLICEGEPGHCPIVEEGLVVENYERLLKRVDGPCIHVMESCVPVMYKGEKHFIESFIDITSLKESQKKLAKSAEELREMNEEIKNFAYIVSHDLRAPLVSIKGFSAELEQSMAELVPLIRQSLHILGEKEQKTVDILLNQDVREALNFINSSVHRMDGQINAILNLSRLGRKDLRPELVDANAVVKTILNSLAHQIEAKRVSVTVEELPSVVADRVSLEQIFGNLLDNALKYLEPGRAGELSISAEVAEEEVIFRVRDNGRGIAQEDMQKVFELFRRAGRQDTQGEGMGLAYVKTLVRRHGGRIWCESQFGVGTTFIFTFQLKPDAPA